MPLLERQQEDERVREVTFDMYSEANLKLTKKLDVLVYLLLCFVKGHEEMIPSDKIRVNKSVVRSGKTSSGARGVENSSDKSRVVGGLQMKSDKMDLLSFRQTREKFYRN